MFATTLLDWQNVKDGYIMNQSGSKKIHWLYDHSIE